jgi:uncharacterized protein YjiS (DUF1127 family)
MHLHTSLPDAIALHRCVRPGVLVSLIGWILGMGQRRRQRLALSSLSDHLRRDIGLANPRARAVAETQFWRR